MWWFITLSFPIQCSVGILRSYNYIFRQNTNKGSINVVMLSKEQKSTRKRNQRCTFDVAFLRPWYYAAHNSVMLVLILFSFHFLYELFSFESKHDFEIKIYTIQS